MTQRLIPVLAAEKYCCRKRLAGIQRLQFVAIKELSIFKAFKREIKSFRSSIVVSERMKRVVTGCCAVAGQMGGAIHLS